MIKTILFTDTHFGIKQNSTTWLNSQLDFIYKQLIPYIKSLKEDVNIICLGDVFDSRSSISTMVATKIVEAFRELRSVVNKFIIIAGNHDYYSPNSSEIDTLSLVFKNLDIKLITNGIAIDGDSIYAPWYSWGDDIIQDIIYQHNIKRIFTHADIVNETTKYKHVDIFSGHIHIPSLKSGLYNLGSCYSLDFADANQERGFYVIDDDNIEFIPNKESIRFWRLYNDDIFKDFNHIKNQDYIEVYVNKSNLLDINYQDRLNILNKEYKNIWIIPRTNDSIIEDEIFEGYDMNNIISNMIPDELKNKFNKILERYE